MSVLRIILGDQLSLDLAALADLDPGHDAVLMMEVAEENTYVRHHKQKIVLVLSAMRHFADELRQRGVSVDYVKLDAPDNTGRFTSEVQRAVARHRPSSIVVTEPSEWRVQTMVEGWASLTGTPVEVRADDRFFASRARFAAWARGRHTWRMEHFYREMRREHGFLMEGKRPAGGEWNYDSANRKRLPSRTIPPVRLRFSPDATTREVMALVERRFADHFGGLEEFGWPVTRTDALLALDDFIAHGLPRFGDYQDAMKAGAPFLFHSLLAPALNLGLLSPSEVCRAAEAAWRLGRCTLERGRGVHTSDPGLARIRARRLLVLDA
jgi:deoxyribodipyrimidine photolyase-related protein